MDKKQLRETRERLNLGLWLHHVVSNAVNGNKEAQTAFINECMSALEKVSIDEKLQGGYKGTGTMNPKRIKT